MKTAVVILSVIVACLADQRLLHTAYTLPYPGTPLFRTPALDSTYVESSRLGGNFAYRTLGSQAYQSYTPLAYSAFPGYPGYPTYTYLQAPFAGPVNFLPYQPAFIEQPLGIKPAIETPAAAAAPAAEAEKPKDESEGRQQVDDDTVAVESA